MADIKIFGASHAVTAQAHRIYTRAAWSNEWTEQPWLECDWLVWATAPSTPQAQMTWDYGKIRRPNAVKFADVVRWEMGQDANPFATQTHWFVKISVDLAAGGTLDWYGQLELTADMIAGTRFERDNDGDLVGRAAGTESFLCNGLIQILDFHRVLQTWWAEGRGSHAGPTDRAVTFNADGLPNRAGQQNRFVGLIGDEATAWSTRDVVKYLVEFHTQDAAFPNSSPPFTLAANVDDVVPDFDSPVLPAHGRRTRSLLDQLLARQRLLGWYLAVDGNENVVVTPYSLADAVVPVADGVRLERNPDRRQLVFDRDSSAEVGLKTSGLDVVDQVVVTGARRRSCFTVSHTDSTLAKGWPAALETEYEAGASGAGDYPAAAERDQRQKRNAEARNTDRLSAVFSRFVLNFSGYPMAWDLKAGDGIGGATNPITPKDGAVDQVYEIYRPEMFLLPTLPLLEGYDYSDSRIDSGTVSDFAEPPFDELSPIVAIRLPEDAARWVQIERVGMSAHVETENKDTNKKWSGTVRVPPQSQALEIQISGQPQHVIAASDFSGQTEDPDLGDFDWQYMVCTVAIEDDRHAEGRYPADGDLWPGAAVQGIRRMFIDAGAGFKRDYVVPGTVVGVDGTTGALKRSTTGGFVRDDTPALERMARMAYEWYATRRAALRFSTSIITDAISLGDMITAIGDTTVTGNHQQSVNSVVTELRLDMPRGEGVQPPPHRIQYQTQYGQLDPLRV